MGNKNVLGLRVKWPVFLSDCNQVSTLNGSLQHEISWRVFQWGLSCYMRTDSQIYGRTDGGTHISYVTGTFLAYAKMPQKRTIIYIVPINRRLFVSVIKNTLSSFSLSLLFLFHFEGTICLCTEPSYQNDCRVSVKCHISTDWSALASAWLYSYFFTCGSYMWTT
jgi:hypothetical protein